MQLNQSALVRVTVATDSVVVPQAECFDVADKLFEKHGRTIRPIIEEVKETVEAAIPVASKPVSTFDAPIMDQEARTRIEALHAAIGNVDASEQLYATGTRLAQVGYDKVASMKAEHDAAAPVHETAEALRSMVTGESRHDEVVSAREIGESIAVNGKISAFGYAVTEQMLRGLTARLESPMLGYILGLRKRIAAEVAKPEEERDRSAIASDKAKLADVLRHECLRAGDVSVKLRMRENPHDIFAAVGPTYAPADAPEVLGQLLNGLPSDARASFAYDPTSTSWELRASVWTPTASDDMAVGEPFKGYASFQSRDNGTSSLSGGGGIELLRCLNASTYVADGAEASRVHRGRIVLDMDRIVQQAIASISTLCQVWGANRAIVIQPPSGVPISEAIPGFWRHLLRDQRSELQGVLPGRSEQHVKALTEAFYGERRERNSIVRSDFAQGWTKYIQSQPTDVRRTAEVAVGDWLMRQTQSMGWVEA